MSGSNLTIIIAITVLTVSTYVGEASNNVGTVSDSGNVSVDNDTSQDRSICEVLESWSPYKQDRYVSIFGKARNVSVQWGARAPSRAAAAMLVAAMRHFYGYKNVELVAGPRTLCELATGLANKPHYNKDSDYDTLVVHVGAEWDGQHEDCEQLRSCNDPRDVCSVAGPRLYVMGGPAAPMSLHLYAHLSPKARAMPICAGTRYWTFYKNTSMMMDCDFMDAVFHNTSMDFTVKLPTLECLSSSKKCVPVLVYPEWNGTYITAIELAARINTTNLPLRLMPLKDDTYLRRLLFNTNESFLFLDYEIWTNSSNVWRVHPPPCLDDAICNFEFKPTTALRVADGALFRQFAPVIFDVIRQLAPRPEHLGYILEHEARGYDLVESACANALSSTNSFTSWAVANERNLWIYVLLCRNDPDKYMYTKLAYIVNEYINKNIKEFSLDIQGRYMDCLDPNDLNQQLFQITRDNRWQRLVGIVGAGEGAIAGAPAAANMETHLVLYDVPSDGTDLHHAARTATGQLQPLLRATKQFLAINGWRRLAIISEKTNFAKEITNALLSDSTLATRSQWLNAANNISSETVLRSFKDHKTPGRIFFINTDPTAAATILCAAEKLEMTSDSYAFIVREWREPAEPKCNLTDIRLFMVTYWWRGGNDSVLPVNEHSKKLRHMIEKKLGRTWPPHAAPIADALLLTAHATAAGLRSHPSLRYDLHGQGSTLKISNSLSNISTVPGVVQTLTQRNFALEKPLLFVYDYSREKSKLLAVWRDTGSEITVVKTIEEAYANSQPPSDGTSCCMTTSSGDPYAPRCHDVAWFTSLVVLLFTLFALYVARRVRLARLAKRDHAMRIRMLARCERTATALGEYLVDRSALELREELGTGHFGLVRLGMLKLPSHPPIPVAVKALRDDAFPAEEAAFLREACVMAAISHTHIIHLIGVCAADGPPLLLMEHAFFGDLRRYLRDRRHLAGYLRDRRHLTELTMGDSKFIDADAADVSSVELTRLGREAASALEYLTRMRFLHRDVRAANCLINNQRMLKLADFGLARAIGSRSTETSNKHEDDYKYVCQRRGLFPVPWMAPESLSGVFSSASDVWSLGVLLLEIATLGARPFYKWEPNRVKTYVLRGGHAPIPRDVTYHTREVIEMCWHIAPDARPSAAEVREYLTAYPSALQPALCPALLDDEMEEYHPTTDSGFGERDTNCEWPLTNDPHISTL